MVVIGPGTVRTLSAVRARPGRSVSALARELSVDGSTATYHLRRLERARLVVGRLTGRERVWYPAGVVCPLLREAWPALERARHVAACVAAGPRDVGAIAAALGDRPGRVRARLASLRRAGFVERGARNVYTAAADLGLCLRALDAGGRCGMWGACSLSRAALEQESAQDGASASSVATSR